MNTTAQTPATVVISRRVRPGEQRNFERWLHKLRRAVGQAQGHITTTVHPPTATTPDQWTVLYQFRTTADLDEWLQSSARHSLVEEGARYLADRPVEQRILQPGPHAVTLVSAVRLRTGTAEQHRLLHQRGVAAARQLGGLMRDELVPAIPGAQPDTVATMTFTNRAHLDRWLDSPQRRAILDDMGELTTSPRTVNILGHYGNFAGWFTPPAATGPKQWKQALVVVVGLIPVSFAVTLIRQTIAPDLPLPVVIVLTAVANVATLTWVVMPLLTRALRSWLIE